MKARLAITVEGDRVTGLSVDPPLGAKVRATEYGPEIHIVTTAASLLEGDELTINVQMGDDSRLTVRTVAAQMAHACIVGGSTSMNVGVQMGKRARLVWQPEPLILCAQSNHRSSVDIDMDEGSALVWTDELVLGRTDDDLTSIAFDARCTVRRHRRLLFDDGLHLDPSETHSWTGPSVLGSSRYLGTVLSFGDFRQPRRPADDSRVTPMALAVEGTLTRVVAIDPLLGRRQLAET